MNQRTRSLIACIAVLAAGLTLASCGPASSGGVHNVRDYGARGDGVTKDTGAIQKAVDACAVTGGEVVFPPGTYVSGTIFMKSGVTLRIGRGATLLGSPNLADYPEVTTGVRSYSDRYVNRSLIYAEGLEDIGLTGEGTIDGNGNGPEFQEEGYANRTRPYVIRCISCRNVRVEDLTLTRSPMWMQHYLACENMHLRGLRIFNHGNRNNDAIDLDGCRNVVVSDIISDTDDDGITLKSTSPFITEHVTITNCVVSSHCNAIKMGTESTGGFRNIAISNCVIKPSRADSVVYGLGNGLAGIALEMVDGGVLEYVTISNIAIEHVGTPIFIKLGNRARLHTDDAPAPPPGILRHVSISNVVARGKELASPSITGFPGHPVEHITLSDIRLIGHGGGTPEQARAEVPENEKNYPESVMFGWSLPASGIYVRHAADLVLDNITVTHQQPDARPALVCDDVTGLAVHGFRAEAPDGGGEPVVRLVGVTDALLSGCRADGGTGVFLDVSGRESGGIVLDTAGLGAARTAVSRSGGATQGAVKVR